MQTLTERVFELAPPGGIFDESVVRNLFPERTSGSRKLLVHRAVRQGEVHRLKPGAYCLAKRYRISHPHPFVLAAVLHSPSHISLESALSFHELIPEAVYGVSSVTSLRSRSFKTPLGTFSFQKVAASQPKAGVRAIKIDSLGWAFVAGPVRAIADLIYLRKNVRWDFDGISFLTQSMRIDEDDLNEMQLDDLGAVYDSVRSRRVGAYLAGLAKEIGE